MKPLISATKSALAEELLYLDGKRVSFKDYPFHYAVYDGTFPALLKKTARQIGKTVHKDSMLIRGDGRPIPATDVHPGTELLSLDVESGRFVPNVVTYVFPEYYRPLLTVTTRQGHVLEVGEDHPIRTWNGWTKAKDLSVGTRVAVVREGGSFMAEPGPPQDRVILTAYMLGDGYIGNNGDSFVSLPGPKLGEFLECLHRVGDTWLLDSSKPRAHTVRIHKGTLRRWLDEDGLRGKKSSTKTIPAWVFRLNRTDTALFLNRLWSTDGHARKATRSLYDISYASMSAKMIHEVQALLWKFGIPTKIRKKWPSIYKKRGDNVFSYELRVETIEGVRRFLSEVGALEKTERTPLPEATGNNNRDTLPDEAKSLVRQIALSRGEQRGRRSNSSLYGAGLRLSPEYPLTYTKAARYLQFFRQEKEHDQTLVDYLEHHLTSHIYWDAVVTIEPTGVHPCLDFEVSSAHNFLVDGVVTHNSTMASNFMITESIARPFFKTLFVAPTKEQTSKFSNTRLSKTLNYSPLIKKRFCSFEDTDNVFLKVLANGSEISLSYASDDPDRIRGISADRFALDEVQDMDLTAVLPVVKECASNSNYGYETYMGTPKSTENGIEWLWQQSTQTEWIMKCPGCSKYSFIEDAKSIGKHGPICVKCGHLLNPREGQWYQMNPGARVTGFHISQPMLPQNCENPVRWERILDKLENYSTSKFKNEVLGVSDSIGTRMISKDELDALCDPSFQVQLPPPLEYLAYPVIAGGVDWSGGGSAGESRTVCWVWGLMPDNRLKMLYYRIFPGRNQVEDVREVAAVFDTFRCQTVCGDAGEGAVANAMLAEHLGSHRVWQVQYGSLSSHIKWNNTDRFMIDRTAFIDSYMLMLKKGGVQFGNVIEMQPAIRDILAEYEEVTLNGAGKKVWRHAPTQPDDALHAGLFAWVALRIARGELQTYQAR